MDPDTAVPNATGSVQHVPGELIEDREVNRATEDLLGHVQIAEQLAEIAATCRTPSNIALYGPWGSGKSGIGNLVRADLESRRGRGAKSIAFARFDAFKYAQHPLRRNFISAVATELGISDSKYHADLYSGRTTTTFAVPFRSAAKVVAIFLAVSLLISLGLLVIVAGAAALKTGDFTVNLRDLSSRAVLAALTPAALLSALVVLVGRAFGVERKTDKADSDEQFEQLFRDLVANSRKDRIVVFVDELDRCEPADVVGTLDTVRTFLGVDKCIFIVAADRHVIEEALSQDVKQATPSDRANPYYSTGSAYLDKVFHYQVDVPPLLQASVTRYAVGLVEDLPGVWAELGDRRDFAVSVLVPSHVRSPRRVKHLLNAYALAYRLAEARHALGALSTDIRSRADELARLVCLRVEFPLFARDLVLDPRLPEYVFRLSQEPGGAVLWEDHPHATDEVKALAKRYADKREPVAALLSDESAQDQRQAAGSLSPAPGADVRVEHGRQLLTYLSRTHHVPGPSRDLIYLRSTGNEFGLDPDLADRLETYAANARTQELRRTLDMIPEDQADGVLMLLIEQVRGALGIEARNVAAGLMAVAGARGVDVGPHADAAISALAPVIRDVPDAVLSGGLAGAWRLAVASDRPAALRLRGLVLSAEDARRVPRVGLALLSDADAALQADRPASSRLLTAHLVSDQAADAADMLLTLPPDAAARLLRASTDDLAGAIKAVVAPPPMPGSAAATSAATALAAAAPAAPAAVAAALPSAEPGGPQDPQQVLDALRRLLAELAPGHDGPAQEVQVVLLTALSTVNAQPLSDLVEDHLTATGTVEGPRLAALLLTECRYQPLSAWGRWTAPIAPAAVRTVQASRPLKELMEELWKQAVDTDDPPAPGQVRGAATAVANLLDSLAPAHRPSLTDKVRASLGDPVRDGPSADRRTSVLDAVDTLADTGVLPRDTVLAKEAEDLLRTLSLDPTQDLADPRVVAYSALAVDRLAAAGAMPASTVRAVHQAAFLPEPQRTALPLIARAAAPPGEDLDNLPPLPPAARIRDLSAEHGPLFDRAVAAWLDLADPEPADLAAAARSAVLRPALDPALLEALRRRTAALPAVARTAALALLLGDPDDDAPTEAALAALGAANAPSDTARVLVDRYKACGNDSQRRRVLDIWQRAGITSDNARRTLVEHVLAPMFALNRTNALAAAPYLQALAPPVPQGLRTLLGDAVKQNLPEDKAVRLLEPLGYRVTETRNWFTRRREVQTGPDDD